MKKILIFLVKTLAKKYGFYILIKVSVSNTYYLMKNEYFRTISKKLLQKKVKSY